MSITVVIPVRDEALTIRRTLDDLLEQSRRPDQVVLVDAGSRDATLDAIAAHALAQTVPVCVLRAGAAYPGRARNLGVAASVGDWVAFTDAGVRLSSSWLETLAGAAAATPDADAIGGDWDAEITSRFTACLALLSVPAPEGPRDGAMRPLSLISLLLRRAAWSRVGPFREDLRSAEDRLFFTRLAAGGHVVRVPGRHARWRPPDTAHATWRRFRTYARHNMRAGLFHEWQAPLLRRYALVAGGAIALSLWTPIAGMWGGVGLWVLLVTGRAAKALYERRGADRRGALSLADDLVRLGPLLALIDAATAAGTLDWLVRDAGREVS
jgi:glycosyltransferase involved in cell wall biosynthesis